MMKAEMGITSKEKKVSFAEILNGNYDSVDVRLHNVSVRLANVPGEILPDAVNTQRGFSFKIL
ncbi:MAG: hypothetical protein EOO47_16585, partial [Flavobacterium sp.]